tara:strand:- start:131 stop:490 length:360 start_codon:yes stop_codon:yes gene_type:complete
MSNEEIRKKLEEKYNINLNLDTEIGQETYWELYDYFTKVIEEDNIIIRTDSATMCCMRTDVKSMKEEFNEKLNEFVKYESNEVCEDPLIEHVMGERCQYANNNPQIQQSTQQEPPPAYE